MSNQIDLAWDGPIGPVPTEPNETALLIARCLDGDDRAYALLYDLYAGITYRLAYSLLQHRQDAEEVLQDSIEYAFRRLDHYDPNKSAFKTWLYRITVSRCRNKRRRKWLPTLSLQQLMGREAEDPAVTPPEEQLALSERQRLIWDALGQLTPKLREVAVLRYYGAMQYAEIGAILDIPPKTAESRMRLAHKKLRTLLEDVIH